MDVSSSLCFCNVVSTYPGVLGPRPWIHAWFGARPKAGVYKGQAGPAHQRTLELVAPLRVAGALVPSAWVLSARSSKRQRHPPSASRFLAVPRRSGSARVRGGPEFSFLAFCCWSCSGSPRARFVLAFALPTKKTCSSWMSPRQGPWAWGGAMRRSSGAQRREVGSQATVTVGSCLVRRETTLVSGTTGRHR